VEAASPALFPHSGLRDGSSPHHLEPPQPHQYCAHCRGPWTDRTPSTTNGVSQQPEHIGLRCHYDTTDQKWRPEEGLAEQPVADINCHPSHAGQAPHMRTRDGMCIPDETAAIEKWRLSRRQHHAAIMMLPRPWKGAIDREPLLSKARNKLVAAVFYCPAVAGILGYSAYGPCRNLCNNACEAIQRGRTPCPVLSLEQVTSHTHAATGRQRMAGCGIPLHSRCRSRR